MYTYIYGYTYTLTHTHTHLHTHTHIHIYIYVYLLVNPRYACLLQPSETALHAIHARCQNFHGGRVRNSKASRRTECIAGHQREMLFGEQVVAERCRIGGRNAAGSSAVVEGGDSGEHVEGALEVRGGIIYMYVRMYVRMYLSLSLSLSLYIYIYMQKAETVGNT